MKCILKAADHAAIKENEADLYTLMWKHLHVILMRENSKVEQTIRKKDVYTYVCLYTKNFGRIAGKLLTILSSGELDLGPR